MAEQKQTRRSLLHHRGRLQQVPIYLGKQFRSFLYMNDWKILPMAAVIAALVAMVVRKYLFITQEGTLMGAFALTCVAIWNGCFNSIQVICRERPIIKREHRSGMHISSYVFSNMVYQAMLCLAQSVVTMAVCIYSNVRFPSTGFMTPWIVVDIGISMFLVAFASDMLSLLVSSIAHTTTAAMTVMPFVLIFQLVFSGSIFTLPAWATSFSDWTISHYGLTAIAAQADYNNQPMKTGWTTLLKLENQRFEGDITLGQLMDYAQSDTAGVQKFRNRTVTVYSPEKGFNLQPAVEPVPGVVTPTDLFDLIDDPVGMPTGETQPRYNLTTMTLDDLADILPSEVALVMNNRDSIDEAAEHMVVNTTVGALLDMAIEHGELEQYRDLSFHYSFTVGDLLNMTDRDKLQERIITASTQAMYNSAYDHTEKNVVKCWMILLGFSLAYALLAMIALEFIDKDKR